MRQITKRYVIPYLEKLVLYIHHYNEQVFNKNEDIVLAESDVKLLIDQFHAKTYIQMISFLP